MFLGVEVDGRTQVEILEDKLKEFIDLTTQKSSQGRVNSFEALCKAFSAKYMPDFVAGRRMTLLDCAEKGMRKGRGAEQESAVKLMALVCLQLGTIADSESIYREQKSYLLSLVADHSASPVARAQVRFVEPILILLVQVILSTFHNYFYRYALLLVFALFWLIATFLKSFKSC